MNKKTKTIITLLTINTDRHQMFFQIASDQSHVSNSDFSVLELIDFLGRQTVQNNSSQRRFSRSQVSNRLVRICRYVMYGCGNACDFRFILRF